MTFFWITRTDKSRFWLCSSLRTAGGHAGWSLGPLGGTEEESRQMGGNVPLQLLGITTEWLLSHIGCYPKNPRIPTAGSTKNVHGPGAREFIMCTDGLHI